MARRPAGALLPALLVLALAACGGGDRAQPEAGDDTGAGAWRTWALRSPADIPVPAPGRKGAAVRATAQATREGTEMAVGRPSVAPWFELAMRFVSERAKDPPAGSRAYALVGVATADAAVAAAHWSERHGRDGYPSQEAAIAGAASRVLAAAFPEHPRARLDAQAEDAAAALVQRGTTREAADAGLELGRAVAGRVLARVDGDGVASGPAVRPPRSEGAWAPPPGSTARPVQPDAGRWATWLLDDGAAVRPPPPPRYGSRAFVAEAREVMAVKERLTPEQARIARFWEGGDGTELPPGIWVRVVLGHLREQGIDGARAARAMALLTAAMSDAGVAAWDAKYAYWSPRPENAIRDLGLDRRWKPLLATPLFPAYPSGHATYSGAAGEVLAHLFPAERRTWRARAEEAAQSRVYGGIHYRADGEAGLEMGRRIGRLTVRRAQRDGAEG